MNKNIKDKTGDFWDKKPCGTKFTISKESTSEFFCSIEEHRYRTHLHIPELVKFNQYKGKKILEIGCGVGTDLRQFARGGGETVGIDLSKNSIKLANQGFKESGYQGNFMVGDGENLGFKDHSFDLVYSFGVLHHTPNTQKAIDEIYRVLKPNGEAIIMLYYKNSYNFLVNILLVKGIWEKKLKGINMQELLNQSTDGFENPLTKVYSKNEARKLFNKFAFVRVYIRYLTPNYVPLIGKPFPKKIIKRLGKICGWHLMIKAIKQENKQGDNS